MESPYTLVQMAALKGILWDQRRTRQATATNGKTWRRRGAAAGSLKVDSKMQKQCWMFTDPGITTTNFDLKYEQAC